MAETAQDTPQAVEQQRQWNNEQCEEALAHLERLQEQLDSLRSTIPSLVSPILRRSGSKAQMFTEIKRSAIQSTDELRTFREDWTSEHTQSLFARASESLKADGNLSKAAAVAKYGWAEKS